MTDHTAEQLAEHLAHLADNAAQAAGHLAHLAKAIDTGAQVELDDRWLADLTERYDTQTAHDLSQLVSTLPTAGPPRVLSLHDLE